MENVKEALLGPGHVVEAHLLLVRTPKDQMGPCFGCSISQADASCKVTRKPQQLKTLKADVGENRSLSESQIHPPVSRWHFVGQKLWE